MGVSEIRSSLIKLINSVDDERLLLAVHNFLKNGKNSEEGRMWSELTEEQKRIVLEAFGGSKDEVNLVEWDEVKRKHLHDREETLIKKNLERLAKLSDQKLRAVSDFADFLLNRIENQSLRAGIQHLVSGSKSYHFLDTEEDLYTFEDLKEKYR